MCGSSDSYWAVPVPECERSPSERDGPGWGVGVDHIVVLHGLPKFLQKKSGGNGCQCPPCEGGGPRGTVKPKKCAGWVGQFHQWRSVGLSFQQLQRVSMDQMPLPFFYRLLFRVSASPK